MLRVGIEDLPLELSWLIAREVQGTHPESLRALSLASRRCRTAVVGVLFRNLKVVIGGDDTLEAAVSACSQTLERHACMRLVRRLNVEGQMHRMQAKAAPEFYVEPYLSDVQPPAAAYEENRLWEPLAGLIRCLSSLVDLVYACPDQLPPCVLDALHRFHPRCRLHLRRFSFRSPEVGPRMDGHELAIATSPCLHSVSACSDVIWRSDPPNHTGDALIQLSNGLAPNLRELRLTLGNIDTDDFGAKTGPCRDVSWEGAGQGTNGAGKSSLEFFKLRSFMRIDIGYLHYLERHIDFTSLRTLKLWCPLTIDALYRLPQIHSFLSLEHFSLTMCPIPSMSSRYRPRPDATEWMHKWPIQHFLTKITGLVSIELGGLKYGSSQWTSFDVKVLERHWISLRSLRLARWMSLFPPECGLGDVPSIMSEQILRELRTTCPNLEELELSLVRTRGDGYEVKIYELLGRVPRLRTLSLVLDAGIRTNFWHHPLGPVDEFEEQTWVDERASMRRNIYYKDVLSTLIMGALDSHLARQIFRTIASGKDHISEETEGIRPLEQLKLHVVNGGWLDGWRADPPPEGSSFTGLADIGEVARTIGCSWLVTATSFAPLQLEASEIPITHRRTPPTRDFHDIEPRLKPIFRRLWPERTGDWRKDWFAFALQPSVGLMDRDLSGSFTPAYLAEP